MSLEVPVLQVAVLKGEAFFLPLAPLLVVKVDVGALAREKVVSEGTRRGGGPRPGPGSREAAIRDKDMPCPVGLNAFFTALEGLG